MRKFTGFVSEPRKVKTRGGGMSYQFRYVARDGRERAVNRPTMTEAVMEAEAVRRSLSSGSDPSRTREPAGPLMEAYIAETEADPDLVRRRKALLINLRVHALPRWRATPIRDITADAIDAWIRDDVRTYRTAKGTPLAASSVRNVHAALSTFMAWAITQGAASHNPCRGVKCAALPKLVNRVVIPDDDEVARLCAAMPDRYQIAVRLAAFGCLRTGEVRGLAWGDIDAERNRLLIRRQLVSGGEDSPPVFGPPKAREWGDDPEEVAIHPDLIAQLVEHRAAYGVENEWDLVVTTPTGKPVSRDHFNQRIWNLARQRAGVPVKFHALRHYAVSLMLRDGTTPVEAAANARHRDGGALIMKVYAHIIGDDRSRAAHALRPSF